MQRQLDRILTDVASDTLEKLAFLFAFPDAERDTDGPEPAVIGRVKYDGCFGGSLLMRISASVIPELAGNMLGLADGADISDDEQLDALKEILNVICGNVLPAIAGDQVEFSIGTPEILTSDSGTSLMKEGQAASVVRFMLEEGFCDLYFFAQGSLPGPDTLWGSEQVQSSRW